MTRPSSLFVYGTLKKAQLRGGMWPHTPIEIVPGCVQAELYDLGPYPAITEGVDWVLGEIWRFREEDIPATSRTLDRIEGYVELGKDNQYLRTSIVAEMLSGPEIGQQVRAFTYFIGSRKQLGLARRILPFKNIDGRKMSEWPDPSARVPKSFSEE